MKTVKSLLLGSAVGFVTVSVGQAADLPVKAKPVEYVKVCSLYGDGFWYIPGTDTCIKLGGFVRVVAAYNAAGGGGITGIGNFGDNGAAFQTRTDTNAVTTAYTGVISIDARTPTDYGTLRSYLDIGSQMTGIGHWPLGGASGISTYGITASNASSGNLIAGKDGNSSYLQFNEGTFVTRAFIQFAGFTAGRMRSFFDVNSLGPYAFGQKVQGDTAGFGVVGFAYTAQLGNGVSASFSLEDGGEFIPMSRGFMVSNLSEAGTWGVLGAPAYGDNSDVEVFDPILALRIDQAWGYAQVSGALHQTNGGYYGTTDIGNSLGTTGVDAGHPANKFGWATTAGFTLNNFLGQKGDTAGAQVCYTQGAIGYCSGDLESSVEVASGNRVANTVNTDGVFATGLPVVQTRNLDFTAFYEHYWNPQWRTSVFGGWVGINYSALADIMICPTGFGGMATWGNMHMNPGATCNPNSNLWQVGTRTMWNPHPYLDIGVEVLYSRLNQSNTGTFTLSTTDFNSTTLASSAAGTGALNPGVYNFANLGIWSAMFRVQRNFLY
jgi:hypothetical protein